MTIELKYFEHECELPRCFEAGPHAHPICPRCGAVGYTCAHCGMCAVYARLKEKGTLGEGLTVREAAAFLYMTGVTARPAHRNTVLLWVKDGRLPNVRKIAAKGRGGSYRFAITDLAVFAPPTKGGRRGRPKKKESDKDA
jgi:hypothetical protein